jgi:hypothetical protein
MRLAAGLTIAVGILTQASGGISMADGGRFSKASLKGDYVCNMTGSSIGDPSKPGDFTELSFVTVETYDGKGNFSGHGLQVAPPFGQCDVKVAGTVQVNSDGTGLRSAGYGLCGGNPGDAGTFSQAIVIEKNGARYDLASLDFPFVLSAYCIRRDGK